MTNGYDVLGCKGPMEFTTDPADGVVNFTFVSDAHGKYLCEHTMREYERFARRFSPQIVISGGDVFDFNPLSKRCYGSPTDHGLEQDLAMGLQFIRDVNPNFMVWGNHDHYVMECLSGVNEVYKSLALRYLIEIKDVSRGAIHLEHCKSRGLLKINGLSIIHGFGSGDQSIKATGTYYGDSLIGHHHSGQMVSVSRDGRDARVWVAPCMRVPEAEYNRKHMNTMRHSNGWVYGQFFPDGTFKCHIETVKRPTLVSPKPSVLTIAKGGR